MVVAGIAFHDGPSSYKEKIKGWRTDHPRNAVPHEKGSEKVAPLHRPLLFFFKINNSPCRCSIEFQTIFFFIRILKIADISASILIWKKKTIRDSLIKMFHSFYIIKISNFVFFFKCDTKHFRLESRRLDREPFKSEKVQTQVQ